MITNWAKRVGFNRVRIITLFAVLKCSHPEHREEEVLADSTVHRGLPCAEDWDLL
jgi:hypothetical protein